MKSAPRASTRHRLAGLALAAAGVVLARFVAPALAPEFRAIAALAGTMIAASGLLVIALGVRHRMRLEAAAIAAVEASAPGS